MGEHLVVQNETVQILILPVILQGYIYRVCGMDCGIQGAWHE